MSDTSAADRARNQKYVAGVIVVVIGIALIVVFRDRDTGCTLTSAGVVAVASAASEGRTAGQVIALSGGVLASKACQEMAKDLMADQTVKVDIKTPGGTQTKRFSLPDLTRPVPPTTVSRMLACRGWTVPVLFQMCADGELSPR